VKRTLLKLLAVVALSSGKPVPSFIEWLIVKYGKEEGVRRFREWQKEV
jgi:hypothetical protein